MTGKYQPLNERLVFIDHHDDLNIQFKTDKTVYASRDAVTLKIKCNRSPKGQAAPGKLLTHGNR